LIESIYIDVVGDGPRASRYILLFEQLQRCEAAKVIHDNMAKRMSARHAQYVAQARKELEEEGERLRRAIKVSKANNK
jgi:hypothetical protein